MSSSNLLQEFNEMKRISIYEIELENGEYIIYHIVADETGVEAGGCTNAGFISYSDELKVEWDTAFSLDEHLASLYEKCYDFSLELEY